MPSFLFGQLRSWFAGAAANNDLESADAMDQAVEQSPGHLGINKDLCPFAEPQNDGDLGALGFVKLAQKMDQ